MEGIHVFIPDDKLVWVPATVLAVEAGGKRFHVRVEKLEDPVDEGEGGDARRAGAEDAAAVERVIDLRDDGMPESLPLQNREPSTRGAGSARKFSPEVAAALVTASAADAGAEDMCELSHLHEPAIVYNVRARFFAKAPYTYTGKIVVAVNPYQWIKPLYSEQLRDLYTQRAWDELPPHVYATSAEAFHHMKSRKIPQSILVSGESGAGKTETVKIMMEHLASISMSYAKKLEADADASGESLVVKKVLKSNPLLEAFGNAKTIRNDNSSRFGKFTQLQFNSDYCLVGAECRHYLLEKSRVIRQAAGERNYHIFYQLVSAKEEAFGFSETSSSREFRYLQDEKLLLDGQTDLERYQVTRDALTTIGLSDDEQSDLFRALCGILRLGQLDFVPLESNKSDASQPVGSLTSSSSASTGLSTEAIAQQQAELEACAKLLGVEVSKLSHQLCSRTVKARQEVYSVPLSTLHAGNNRDALAKEVYARIFAYLVRRVNYSISQSSGGSHSKRVPTYMHIDLLDIFGFESFKHNSFEQFCINYANEKLQQKFTLDVFKTVQEEYEQEGVAWEFVKYRDNQDMLDLMENSMGLIALLNEECVRPKGSDLSFASKIVSLHESHPRLEKARLNQTQFLLRHYAGRVTYDAVGFVEKNKDSLQSDLLELLATSSNSLVSLIFGSRGQTAYMTDSELAARAASIMDSGSGGRRSVSGRKTSTFMQETVSYKFKAQLSLLMTDISSTEVHYVRCIKPNSNKSPNMYEIDAVVNQLRCAGVVEAIRITRAAFPNKMAHEKFLRRFVFMKGSKTKSTVASLASNTVTEACEHLAQELLTSYEPTQDEEHSRTPPFVVGRSLVYFGKDVLEYLEHQRTTYVHERALLIQRSARRWVARRRFKRLRAAVTLVQALQRCRSVRQAFLRRKLQVTIVQSMWRGVRSRQRMYLLMKEKMAVRIQAAVRRYFALKRYSLFRDAVVKMQSQVKMKKQVGKYKAMLTDKKEQAIMETEVDLLKKRLEEEKRARIEIEAENSSLQQELLEVRHSSAPGSNSFRDNDLLAPYGSAPPLMHRESTGEDSKLLDDSERMIDYLRLEVAKGRETIEELSIENDNLKMENKKIKDAYNAAGASFAALNKHNKQQSKANLRLMSTHAALIKSQEEKMKKYQKQIADLKEDLKMQRNVYSAELQARVQQQDVLVDMIQLAESYGVAEDVLERMRSMAVVDPHKSRRTSRGDQHRPVDRVMENRPERSDTDVSIGPVPVSVSVNPTPRAYERRSTIDTIMNNPMPRGEPKAADAHDDFAGHEDARGGGRLPNGHLPNGHSPSGGAGNRGSVYDDENGHHRKSRIGGMFKKMFKKDE